MLTVMAEQTIRQLDTKDGVIIVDTTPLQLSFTISSPDPNLVTFLAVRGNSIYKGELYTPLFANGDFAGFPMLAAKYDQSSSIDAGALTSLTSLSICDFMTADTILTLSERGRNTVTALLQTA